MSRRFVSLVNACLPLKALAFCLLALCGAASPARAQSSQDPVYVFHTTLGDISVQLYPDTAPQTVANFLRYVSAGDYNNSLIHRSVPSFIFQGGGYQVQNGTIATVPAFPPVVNEFHTSNTRGTIAMAKLGGSPNSATSQWFFNELDSNASNLDNQNGGFTVFGKVADSASLAVMDQLAAVPVPNPSPFNPPLDQIPLINYQAGATVQVNNLVTVSSITPASNHTHILWHNPDGQATLWFVNPDSSFGISQSYGPYTDSGGTWQAVAFATGPDNVARLLWRNPDGQATLWRVNPDGSFSPGPSYGPYTDTSGTWQATAASVGPDDVAHILWRNPDGRATLWYVNPDGSHGTSQPYGPYSDAGGTWQATALATGPDGVSRILWRNPDGQATLWRVNADSSFSPGPSYGPYTDAGGTWQAVACSVGPDSVAHILWRNPDGQATLWSVNANGSFGISQSYGPYVDGGGTWQATALATDPSGVSRILWRNPDGQATLWRVNADSSFSPGPSYGPYTDTGGTWQAVADAAGP